MWAEILLDGDHASQVRDYAAKPAEKEPLSSSEAVEQARKQGMAAMSEKFLASGAEVYVAEE